MPAECAHLEQDSRQVSNPQRATRLGRARGHRSAIYTCRVRRAFAAILVSFFVVITTADGFACPDGCTDESPTQAAAPHAASSCAFCHGYRSSPIVVSSRPTPRLIAFVTPVSLDLNDPVLPAIELPPKSA